MIGGILFFSKVSSEQRELGEKGNKYSPDTESLVDTGQQKNWDPRAGRRSTGVAVDTVPDDWGR